ncbi:hypothetical protein NCS13_1_1415 [Neochlamydia sp. S13]|nr:hypothetical protein NCS13_1_1415 [Neochlamydia sp. S13]
MVASEFFKNSTSNIMQLEEIILTLAKYQDAQVELDANEKFFKKSTRDILQQVRMRLNLYT